MLEDRVPQSWATKHSFICRGAKCGGTKVPRATAWRQHTPPTCWPLQTKHISTNLAAHGILANMVLNLIFVVGLICTVTRALYDYYSK